ncbi:class I SAM-dependent DNA methyltransferase [Oceanirhabdus seepicola]|uniref:site-specific DNA-methyltransferase (adenine-specific) n=1 Tax=Oceanirhabdus seepicola TaxID=2828781 RepID=A0A9J6P4Z8_9CLOT|nr:DNA methyltransferase [Oceanirhabdus seepicola]MCM1991308.1 class I SAM-dependent DNA methyltransferase [Oceanirhabdus seepicola]
MNLGWNEIRKRAIRFSTEWKDETSENAEAKTFWNDFFNVFGITRRRIASFEKPVKKLGNKKGFIDLFWKGVLIVEHKSRGKNLDKAYSQALDYFYGLKEEELPRYVLVSDFNKFRLYDLEENIIQEFLLQDFFKNIHLFSFMTGYITQRYIDEDPVNIKAAELMRDLHDRLKESGYTGQALERLLVRIMFCLFADDTGIFNKNFFKDYIERNTKKDGEDLGLHLTMIFQILDTSTEKRQINLGYELKELPYVNGKLFNQKLPIASFNSEMRNLLLKCCYFNWSKVSPAIFGSMFQLVMDEEKRKNIGAFYTSEKNILKSIKDLFLDDLFNEFKRNKNNHNNLKRMLKKIREIKILDPACGCGNFLVIAYRELRRLELEIYKELYINNKKYVQMSLDIKLLYECIDVDSMYGIEVEEFPANVAQVAIWLVDHQMNMELSQEFGEYFVRLPLKKAPNIINENALNIDWDKIVSKTELTYIVGNPPFIAKKNRTMKQNIEMDIVCNGIKNYKLLDYVCCWYIKTAEFIQNTNIKVALISTNSITQGEQVSILWKYLLEKGVTIDFAHRTFKWSNGAGKDAQVYVVIIGCSCGNSSNKLIYDYETPISNPMKIKVKNINPYLLEQENLIITNRTKPICNVPSITFGNMPNDKGNFLFTDEEKKEFLLKEPRAKKFFKPFISAREFLHNEKRWCLWLKDVKPSEIKKMAEVYNRIKNVKEIRLASKRVATRKLAEYPYLFGEIRQSIGSYILIPRHSSEMRKYIPMDFFTDEYIAGDSCCIIQNATLFNFGVLMSEMHMAWVRQICGRIKSDFRYSNKLVYNNFPWPENPSDEKVLEVERLVKKLFLVRKEYKKQSLAQLYDPLIIPYKLSQVHKELDIAVDRCYRQHKFLNDFKRLQLLFDLYKKYTSED